MELAVRRQRDGGSCRCLLFLPDFCFAVVAVAVFAARLWRVNFA